MLFFSDVLNVLFIKMKEKVGMEASKHGNQSNSRLDDFRGVNKDSEPFSVHLVLYPSL